MDTLFNKLCDLSTNPFADEPARTYGQALIHELTATQASTAFIAGGDFVACHACSDPGNNRPPFIGE
jgi:hypothetical protein